MPLETYTGKELRPLMAMAEADFGPDAVMVQVKRIHRWDGSGLFELVAGDPDSARMAARSYVTVGNAPILTSASPNPKKLRRSRTDRPTVMAIVGPTGAGKTTTIAKLVSSPRVFGLRRTSLVTMDTYRVGAIEQLRTYAELAQVPFQVIYSEKDIEPTMRRLAPSEMIIVDTPGWGPKNHKSREVIEEWLRRINPDEVHLALPVGWTMSLIEKAFNDYEPLGVTHVLPTKFDELPTTWGVFDLAAERHYPMRWITDGQEVPEDIRPACPRLLASMTHLKGQSGRALVGAA
jgi:flagellar biosynthesis protein FlhF